MGVAYVDVEISIVNVKTVDSLAEVDVGNAIGGNVVVINNAELNTGNDLLDESSGGLNIVAAGKSEVRLLDGVGLAVARKIGHGVAGEVDTALAKLGVGVGMSALRMSVDSDQASKAKNH